MSFRALRRLDFGLLADWLAEPLVARWWNHETSPEAVERDFGPSVDRIDDTEMFVSYLDGRAVGLIQRYPIAAYPEYVEELSAVCDVPPGALSVDYLIGEPDVRGRGVGAAMIARFVAGSWTLYPHADHVIVPVSCGNRASWRALARAGFRRIAEGELAPDNPNEPRDHYVYQLERAASRSAPEHG